MLKFTKMHGVGNDFIVIEKNKIKKGTDKNNLARILCNRHTGIGGDGLLIFSEGKTADIDLEIYNSDGSEATMCGNGVRCIAKYFIDKYSDEKDKLSIHTKAGIKYVTYKYDDDFIATVDIGTATFGKDSMGLYTDESVIYNYPLKISKGIFNITCVYLGNLHTVIFVDNLMLYPFDEIALEIQKNSLFLNSTNVEFVNVLTKTKIEMLVYERGCGETLGCGTGASAAMYTACKMGKTTRSVNVKLKGGTLKVFLDPDTNHIFLTGPAETVYTGEYPI